MERKRPMLMGNIQFRKTSGGISERHKSRLLGRAGGKEKQKGGGPF